MLFEEIKIFTKDISSVSGFYKDVMELPLAGVGKKAVSISAGVSKLVFQECKSKEDPFYHFAFNIPWSRFYEALNWMQERVELLWLDEYNGVVADFVKWHARSFYFLDPAGNILELIARFDLNDHASEKFSAAHIRNISEIGLVFRPEVFDQNAASLLHKYNLEYFSKQPPMNHFRTIGDDEGLFIVVPENRNWFSTNKSSAIFPVEIRFRNKGHQYKVSYD